jgi:putative SOS response-associated peptidase YedK
LRQGRCLIPASGFYEWKGEGKLKRPFFIRPKGGEGIFVFAGLYCTWTGPEVAIPTCTIITITPNDWMAGIYDRLPVILEPENQEGKLENWHDKSMG